MAELDYGGVHGMCMIVAFLILSQLAESIAVFVHAKTNVNQGFFQVYEKGHLFFNVHRVLMTLAFLLGIIGLIFILSSPDGVGVVRQEVHVIFGIIMLSAFFLQIALRLAFPGPGMKPFHRWFGRAISFWGFVTAWEGFNLADGPGSDGFQIIYILGAIFYSIKLGFYGLFKMAHSLNKVKKYDPPSHAPEKSLPVVGTSK